MFGINPKNETKQQEIRDSQNEKQSMAAGDGDLISGSAMR